MKKAILKYTENNMEQSINIRVHFTSPMGLPFSREFSVYKFYPSNLQWRMASGIERQESILQFFDEGTEITQIIELESQKFA